MRLAAQGLFCLNSFFLLLKARIDTCDPANSNNDYGGWQLMDFPGFNIFDKPSRDNFMQLLLQGAPVGEDILNQPASKFAPVLENIPDSLVIILDGAELADESSHKRTADTVEALEAVWKAATQRKPVIVVTKSNLLNDEMKRKVRVALKISPLRCIFLATYQCTTQAQREYWNNSTDAETLRILEAVIRVANE